MEFNLWPTGNNFARFGCVMSADSPWKLRKGRIEFILVSVPATNSERLIADLFDLTLEHNAEVDLISSVVVITYGTAGTEALPKGRRFALIEALRDKFGPQIKIVHGAGIGHSGYVGGKSGGRFNYILPGLKEAKTRLEDLQPGEIVEFVPEPQS